MLNVISGHVAHSKKTGIGKLHLESDAVGRLRLHIDLQQHFEYVIGKLIGTDVELNVDLGLPLPLINRGRIGVFEGKVLHILGNKPNLRHSVRAIDRSEEHTSELQSLMRISYAVFCLKQTKSTST